MKKFLAFVLSLAMLLTGAMAAQAADFNPAEYAVAIAMPMYNHPVHRIVQLGFLKAAQELGYTNAKVIGTEGGDMAESYAAIDAFVAEGGKACMVWAGDSSAYECIANAAAAGVVIGVAHFNHRLADGTLPEGMKFNMACDPVLYGKQSAELLAKTLEGKTGSIALTQNTKNITENAANDSFRASWAELAKTMKLENIRLLNTELEGGVVDSATAVNLAIIQANPDIIGAFGTTGNSPITWSDAATKAGKADGEIAIIGMDATEGNLNALESGKVLALVAQPLYQEAYLTMTYFDKVLRGEEVPVWTDLTAPIVTRDGTGENGIEFHRGIASEVATFFK
ncbi:MAG: sugar ABC transporter substrate-binding protein [Eubacteriales bacterium]|nr:sugar ABC transporter substrate-binding protein [Eubacteriales bacterium]